MEIKTFNLEEKLSPKYFLEQIKPYLKFGNCLFNSTYAIINSIGGNKT
jgi:hypothetical protein